MPGADSVIDSRIAASGRHQGPKESPVSKAKERAILRVLVRACSSESWSQIAVIAANEDTGVQNVRIVSVETPVQVPMLKHLQ